MILKKEIAYDKENHFGCTGSRSSAVMDDSYLNISDISTVFVNDDTSLLFTSKDGRSICRVTKISGTRFLDFY